MVVVVVVVGGGGGLGLRGSHSEADPSWFDKKKGGGVVLMMLLFQIQLVFLQFFTFACIFTSCFAWSLTWLPFMLLTLKIFSMDFKIIQCIGIDNHSHVLTGLQMIILGIGLA